MIGGKGSRNLTAFILMQCNSKFFRVKCQRVVLQFVNWRSHTYEYLFPFSLNLRHGLTYAFSVTDL